MGMAPPPQRYRQIGFYLDGGAGEAVKLDLAIRPEDLTVTEPSRLNVQQTLGGAWADSFGRGLVTINLAGTLGWRGSLFLSGEDAFKQLRSTVLLDWHRRREEAIDQGSDPGDVTLTFLDTLDDLSYIVAPQQFSLRRSKSSPLLMRYQLRLIALSDADAPRGLLDKIAAALSNPLRWLAGVTGLGGVLTTLNGYYMTAKNLYGAATSAVRFLVGTALDVLGAVRDVASGARGLFSGANAELLSVARALSQAAGNALSALATDDSLPVDVLIPAARLASVFNDADCTMANCFSSGVQFATYDDLFGASMCSSTGGGEPISRFTAAGANPFESIFPKDEPVVLVTAEAAAAMRALRADPLTLLGQDLLIAHQLGAISAGVTVPGAPARRQANSTALLPA